MAETYTYAHTWSTDVDKLRFLIGDHRGTGGSATGWLFSNEELTAALAAASSSLLVAARICIQCRACREAMAAGVAGTTDTTDRPSALINAIRALERLDYPGQGFGGEIEVTDESTLSETP